MMILHYPFEEESRLCGALLVAMKRVAITHCQIPMLVIGALETKN